MIDEYGIGEILQKHRIVSVNLLEDICTHLDKTLTTYLQNEEEQCRSVHIEYVSYLLQALFDSDKGKVALKDRIHEIVKCAQEGINKEGASND